VHFNQSINSDQCKHEISKLLVEKLSNARLQTGLQQLQVSPNNKSCLRSRRLKSSLALQTPLTPYANPATLKTFTEQSQAFCLIEQICWLLLSHVLAYLCVYRAEPAHSICLLPWLT